MKYPLISIAIATFNSEETLEKTLDSIKKQIYPKNKIEILIIDGGSVDNTINIAKRYRCQILPNKKIELIYAKHIGFLKAKGKYLMFLDSDEVLENPCSLRFKYSSFQKNNKVKAVMISGYKTPTDYSKINNYTNEFGDPFSFFIFRESKGEKFLLQEWSQKYKKVYEDKVCAVFDFSHTKPLPIIELWAGGCMIDLEYVRTTFPDIKKKPELVAHLFYLLNKKKILLAITKNDPTIHYSSKSYKEYLKKIGSRIKNNVYKTPMGEGGFGGRENFQPLGFRIKKYFFPLYSYCIILPIWDAIKLITSRRSLVYLMHIPLSIYTASLILFYLCLKALGIYPKIQTYGK